MAQNCYAYAVNHPAPIDPGDLSNSHYNGIGDVGKAAVRDGLIKKQPMSTVPNEYYVVALWVSSDGDNYHWARREGDGRWSHKPGEGDTRYTDANEQEINDDNPPDDCDMNFLIFFESKADVLKKMAIAQGWAINYDIFSGYYLCPKNGL